MASYGNSIAEFVKKFREYSKYSQGDLGKVLGYHPQYISNIERGVNKRPLSFCRKLMRKLDTTRQNHLDELIRDAVMDDVDKRIRKK